MLFVQVSCGGVELEDLLTVSKEIQPEPYFSFIVLYYKNKKEPIKLQCKTEGDLNKCYDEIMKAKEDYDKPLPISKGLINQ